MTISENTFHKPMNYPDDIPLISLTNGYDASYLKQLEWGIGGYAEKRSRMYTSPLYIKGGRHIHMGVDIWRKAGEPVYAVADGLFWGDAFNPYELDYGSTLIYSIELSSTTLFILYGHLSRSTLGRFKRGEKIKKGQMLGWLGDYQDNGGWVSHLHLQCSNRKPEKIDMPGVVTPEELNDALLIYPNPIPLLNLL